MWLVSVVGSDGICSTGKVPFPILAVHGISTDPLRCQSQTRLFRSVSQSLLEPIRAGSNFSTVVAPYTAVPSDILVYYIPSPSAFRRFFCVSRRCQELHSTKGVTFLTSSGISGSVSDSDRGRFPVTGTSSPESL